MIDRRTFMTATAVMVLGCIGPAKGTSMFGLIGKMSAKPGQRDALIALVLEGADAMPGCLSYIVAKDGADENGIWITEVWDSETSHEASLQLPAVVAAIGRAMPLIETSAEGLQQKTIPIGGLGLAQTVDTDETATDRR